MCVCGWGGGSCVRWHHRCTNQHIPVSTWARGSGRDILAGQRSTRATLWDKRTFLAVAQMQEHKVWVWLRIKQEGLPRFWSMFPLTRIDFGTGFVSHSHVWATGNIICPHLGFGNWLQLVYDGLVSVPNCSWCCAMDQGTLGRCDVPHRT